MHAILFAKCLVPTFLLSCYTESKYATVIYIYGGILELYIHDMDIGIHFHVLKIICNFHKFQQVTLFLMGKMLWYSTSPLEPINIEY